MIEAIRRRGPGYLAAVQWHPEFHDTEHGTFDDGALLDEFLAAARATRIP
jgi:putative glutamine amidotransferase